MKDKTIIYVTFPGDRSVGIPDGSVKVEFNYNLLECVDREETREHFREFFSQYEECGKSGIRFNDECPDCGSIGFENGECLNKKGCLRNMPEMD